MSMTNMVKQSRVVTQNSINPNQGVESIALFNSDGSPYSSGVFIDREVVVFDETMADYELSSDDETKRIILTGDYLSILVPLDSVDDMTLYCNIPIHNYTDHPVSCYNSDVGFTWFGIADELSPSIPEGSIGWITKIAANRWAITAQDIPA